MANWRGTWASGTAYAAGDAVSYGGASYYCATANTGQAPGTGADWALEDIYTGPPAAGGGGVTAEAAARAAADAAIIATVPVPGWP